MKEELCSAFPTVTYWRLDYQDDLWTLSGCYGAYVIPWVFGCSLQYAPDRWPVMTGGTLSVQDMERLTAESLLSGAPVEELFEQMDIIESESGKIHGYLNWQGVLNNAFHLRGQRIFLDMVDCPDLVHSLFSLICDVMVALAQRVQERQRRSGFYVNHFCVSNCTVNMISPQYYRDFVFPYDKRIAESFERFGVHTCNWDVSPYLEELRRLPKVGYLDMGMTSDMQKAKTLFPETRRAVLYSPVKLEDAPIEEIRRDMEKIREELSPCDVVMADVQATTLDSRVNELLKICHTLEDRGI
jgi:uroporphyrinogen-III decarboxylase